MTKLTKHRPYQLELHIIMYSNDKSYKFKRITIEYLIMEKREIIERNKEKKVANKMKLLA